MFNSLKSSFVLNNGVKIPCVAYGTYKTPDGEVCSEGVRYALECGYRHIDTAQFYNNEEGVGEGIRRSGLSRDQVFLTTKVWNSSQGYRNTIAAFQESKRKLGMNYVDLYLIHWPIAFAFKDDYPARFIDTWRALESLYRNSEVRAIGVCNCKNTHLKTLMRDIAVKPSVNQIEYHYGFDQSADEEYSKSLGLIVEAWAPLCKGKYFGGEPLKSVALKYGKAESQILVRWCLQHGVLPLPKSVNRDRILENSQVFDFNISDEDMHLLDSFDGVGRLGSDPDKIVF